MNDTEIKAKMKELYESFFSEMCRTAKGNIGENSPIAQAFKGPAMEAASRIVTQMVVDLGYTRRPS